MNGKEPLSDDDVFRSNPADCAVDDRFGESFFTLKSGLRMTCQPIYDPAAKLTARLGHHPAAEWLAAHGMRLPTSAENHELYRAALAAGHHIDPYTMPTIAMLKQAGIPLVEQTINTYRTQHMMSSAWCAIHDAAVIDRLRSACYGSGPVANMGKHWISPVGLLEGWWYKDGSKIQNASSFHAAEKTFVDYATTFHGVVLDDESNDNDNETEPLPEPHPWRDPLAYGMKGQDVAEWQALLVLQGHHLGTYGDHGDGVDGHFGGLTMEATQAWQLYRGVDATGMVDQATRAAIGKAPISPVLQSYDYDNSWLDDIPLIEAANYTKAYRSMVHWIVLHSTENPPLRHDGSYWPGKARNVTRLFAGSKAPQASAHYIIGGGADVSTEVYQGVDEEHVAWAAPGANRYGIQIEIVGNYNSVAGYPPTSWTLPVMRPTLGRTAAVTARALQRWSIPLKHVSRDTLGGAKRMIERWINNGMKPPFGLPDEYRGIITHADASNVWKKSDHCDPGGPTNKTWPMKLFLDLVEQAME